MNRPSSAVSRFAPSQSSRNPAIGKTNSEQQRVRAGDAPGGNRARHGAVHFRVGFAFVPLIQRGRAAGDQRGADQRVQQRDPGPGGLPAFIPHTKPMAVLIRMKQVMRGLVSSR